MCQVFRLHDFNRVIGLVVGYRWLDYDYEESVPVDPDYFKFDDSIAVINTFDMN